MTTPLVERVYPGDWVANALPGFEEVMLDVATVEQNISATVGIESGTIMQFALSSTKLEPCTTGSDAVAILWDKIDVATLKAGDVNVLVLDSGPIKVNSQQLTCGGSGQLAAAMEALAQVGIKDATYGVTWVVQLT